MHKETKKEASRREGLEAKAEAKADAKVAKEALALKKREASDKAEAAKADTSQKPLVANYPELDGWLIQHGAHSLWRAALGGSKDPSAYVECYSFPGKPLVALVTVFSNGGGWEIYTPTLPHDTLRTLKQAEERLGLQATNRTDPTGKVAPFHSNKQGDQGVYHDNGRCTEGNNIEPANRIAGTAGRAQCSRCKSLE